MVDILGIFGHFRIVEGAGGLEESEHHFSKVFKLQGVSVFYQMEAQAKLILSSFVGVTITEVENICVCY